MGTRARRIHWTSRDGPILTLLTVGGPTTAAALTQLLSVAMAITPDRVPEAVAGRIEVPAHVVGAVLVAAVAGAVDISAVAVASEGNTAMQR